MTLLTLGRRHATMAAIVFFTEYILRLVISDHWAPAKKRKENKKKKIAPATGVVVFFLFCSRTLVLSHVMPTVESTVQLHATAGGNQGLPSNRGPRLLSYYSDQFLKAFISRLKKKPCTSTGVEPWKASDMLQILPSTLLFPPSEKECSSIISNVYDENVGYTYSFI